jgi:hypothetical protein
MTTDFYIPGVSKSKINEKFVCPKCEAMPSRPSYVDCPICWGYGTDPDDDPFLRPGFQSSYGSLIIHELLNYGTTEKDSSIGTLDPSDVLIRLTTVSARIANLVQPASVSQGTYIDANGVGPGATVYNMGLSEERLQRYIDSLRELAEVALAAGKEIRYS